MSFSEVFSQVQKIIDICSENKLLTAGIELEKYSAFIHFDASNNEPISVNIKLKEDNNETGV